MKTLGTRLSRQEMRSVTGGYGGPCTNPGLNCQKPGYSPTDCGPLGYCCDGSKACAQYPGGPLTCPSPNAGCYQIPD